MDKKYLKSLFMKILLVCMALMLCFLASCQAITKEGVNTIQVDLQEKLTKGGIHNINVVKTNKNIIDNGLTNYCILIPDNHSSEIQTASKEIREFLAISSNVMLKVVKESEYDEDELRNYISIGNTNKLNDAEIIVDYNLLGSNGYTIKTVNDNIFIVGGGNKGTLNGVYEFLLHTIDFTFYASDEIKFSRLDKVPLSNFDIVDVPDFKYRLPSAGLISTVATLERLRLNSTPDALINAVPSTWHNTFEYIPPDTYSKTNPKFFSVDGMQLCFTARGDSAELEKMVKIVADKIVVAARTQTGENVTITQEDHNVWCNCETCKSEKNKYGTDSAVMLKFCNLVSDLVKEKFEESEDLKDRVMNICFFAYHRTEKAPAVKNSQGVYEPIEDLRCNDNVFPFYAPIFVEYTKSFYHPDNSNEAETMLAWRAVSDKLFLWTYQTNFIHYLYPYNSIPTMQDRYRFMRESSAEYVYDQSQWNQPTSTAFQHFKTWLTARLLWNVDLDTTSLTNSYFDNYFYESSDTMLNLFNQITTHMTYLENNVEGVNGDVYFSIDKAKYFKFATLNGWLKLIDNAYADIAHHKDADPELYDRLYNRINTESIFIRFALITLHTGRYDTITLNNMRNSFKSDCVSLNITRYSEPVELSTVWSNWK